MRLATESVLVTVKHCLLSHLRAGVCRRMGNKLNTVSDGVHGAKGGKVGRKSLEDEWGC